MGLSYNIQQNRILKLTAYLLKWCSTVRSLLYHKESNEQKKQEVYNKKILYQKQYFDKRRQPASNPVNIRDQVLVTQEKSTTKPPFNPCSLKVTSLQGNRVTATDECKSVTRDTNQLKKIHPCAKSSKPTLERGATFTLGPPI